MSLDPGAVTIRAAVRGGALCNVRVQSQRPRITPWLAGRSPAQVEATLPLVFSLCGRAHAAAARAAVAAARGAAPDPGVDAAVAAEAARELLFAVLTGDSRPMLARAQRCLLHRPELARMVESELLGMTLDDHLGIQDASTWRAWAGERRTPLQAEAARRLALPEPVPAAVCMLPVLDAGDSLSLATLTPEFAAAPRWRDEPAETGSVSRQHAHPLIQSFHQRPLLQRWLARLVELLSDLGGRRAPIVGRVTAVELGFNAGRAIVQTARGTLWHEVVLREDSVAAYVIVAPTEWNFHPQGPLRGWLDGQSAASSAVATSWIERAAEALDPCVACRILVEE